MSKNVLSELSNTLAQTVATAGASVVRVDARRRIPASGIVWTAEGHILTAHHVLRQDENIQVGLADGQTVTGQVVGRDPSTDLAILKVEAGGLTPLTEANKQEVAVGHLVLALGRPGKTVQATLGIISAYGDGWRTRLGGQIDHYLQTDVVMYPGFSGGPLVNASGHLVGLNSSALLPGVSLTTPTGTLSHVVDTLLAHGRVRRGYLGVSTQRVHLPQGLRESLGQKGGLLVISVETGSPAEQAGLTLGDTIVGLGETAIHNHDDLMAQLGGSVVGQAVALRIVRGGQVQTLSVTVGERP